MTKPCNFPERKNQRRKDALSRLGFPRKDGKPRDHNPSVEVSALQSAIVVSARGIHTKKNRSDRARIRL